MIHTAGVILKALLNLQDNFKRIEKELLGHKSRIEALTHQSIRHETIIGCRACQKSLRK